MAALLPAAPARNPIAGGRGMVGTLWDAWFRALTLMVNRAPQVMVSRTWTAQTASLSTTTLVSVPATGLYRLSYAVRVTQAATSSSSLRVTLGWTDGAVAQTAPGESLIGNTTTTREANSVLMRADVRTLLTVAVSYSSSGATAMAFGLDVVAEQMP